MIGPELRECPVRRRHPTGSFLRPHGDKSASTLLGLGWLRVLRERCSAAASNLPSAARSGSRRGAWGEPIVLDGAADRSRHRSKLVVGKVNCRHVQILIGRHCTARRLSRRSQPLPICEDWRRQFRTAIVASSALAPRLSPKVWGFHILGEPATGDHAPVFQAAQSGNASHPTAQGKPPMRGVRCFR